MKNKFLITFVFLLILGALSSCSDFRKAVGKEKVIPDEFSVAVTPSLLIPPGYKIDPQLLKQNKSEGVNNNFSLSEEIDIKNKNVLVIASGGNVDKDIFENCLNEQQI